MEKKTFNILFVSVFAMILAMGLASATITLSPSLGTLSQTSGSFNVTVLSDQNETINLNIPSISDNSGNSIMFSVSPAQLITDTSSGTINIVTVNYVVPSTFNFEFGKTYNANLTAFGTSSGQISTIIPFAASSFCQYNNPGQLDTVIKNVGVESGFGSDGKWYPFDKVQFDVRVDNNGNDDVNNVALEWGLYDTQSKTWAVDVNDYQDFDLSSGDENTVTITFTLDNSLDETLQDLKKGTYVIYARATGQVNSGTYDGDNTCSSDSYTGNLELDRNFVILNNLQSPDTTQCGAEADISADVWNIGSHDQTGVYAMITNTELGISQRVDIGTVDSLHKTDFNVPVQVPDSMQEKNYTLTLTVYDSNDNVFEDSNNDQSIFTLPLNVQGGCTPKASVSAVLSSGGEAGKPMVVKATITNTGSKSASYSLNVADYSNWADSATLDKTSLTLDAGDSADVLLTFNVNKDALGSNLFNLEVLSGGQLVVSQPVQVNVTKKTFSLGNIFSGNNGYIWGIGLLNLILIILIIVIAIRISKK